VSGFFAALAGKVLGELVRAELSGALRGERQVDGRLSQEIVDAREVFADRRGWQRAGPRTSEKRIFGSQLTGISVDVMLEDGADH
jgi:hypothetical protein